MIEELTGRLSGSRLRLRVQMPLEASWGVAELDVAALLEGLS